MHFWHGRAFGYAPRMSWPKKLLIALVLAALGVAAWLGYAAHDRRQQHKALGELVAQTTIQLRDSLVAAPSSAQALGIESSLEALRATRKTRERRFAEAAEQYLVTARAIALRRVDAARLSQHAQATRQLLAAHMSASGQRGSGWIRQAAELQRRMAQSHADLGRTLEAQADLLLSLFDVEKALAGHVGPQAFLERATLEAALKRAQDEVKAVAAEAERAKRLPG